MELLEIKSAHDLTARPPAGRQNGLYTYLISCRQFMNVLAAWRKPVTRQGPSSGRESAFGLMTLAADRIWVTEPEIAEIEQAVFSARPSIQFR